MPGKTGRCCRCHGRHTGGQRLAGAPPGQETRIGTEEGSLPNPKTVPAIRLHRAGGRHALKRTQQSKSNPGEHPNHPYLYQTARDDCRVHIPTVSLDVISLVASSCGYYRGQIAQRAAHEFAVHLVTQKGLAKHIQHRHPPRAQPVAPLRERHCRRPRLTLRRGTAQAPLAIRDNPVAHTGGETTPSPHHSS